MTKKVVVSAPGKVHLMGEHAVVYGRPALLAAVDLRCRVKVTEASGFEVRSEQGYEDGLVLEAVRQVMLRCGMKGWPKVKVEVDSDVLVGRGLGSSAAVVVAVVGSVMKFFGEDWDVEVINDLAYEVEKRQHGNPSGGDNTVATYGGTLLFRERGKFESIEHRDLNNLFFIDTGEARESTKEMVEYVRAERGVKVKKYEGLFDKSGELTERMAKLLEIGSESELVEVIWEGERVLEEMGVVSRETIRLIRQIEDFGGAAKISGAGGRSGSVGIVLAYCLEAERLETWGRTVGLRVERVTLACEGVRGEA